MKVMSMNIRGAATAPGPAVVTPPTARGQLAQQRVKAAAREVFREVGFGNARVSDIAVAAGLSNGAFYRYYKDKYQVMLALMHELLATGFGIARSPWDAEHPEASVEQTTVRYLQFYEQNTDLFRILVETAQVYPEVEEMWAAVRDAIVERIERMLRRGQREGVVRADVDVKLAAGLLAAMTDHFAYLRYVLRRMPERDIAAVAEEVAHTWGRGVFVRPVSSRA